MYYSCCKRSIANPYGYDATLLFTPTQSERGREMFGEGGNFFEDGVEDKEEEEGDEKGLLSHQDGIEMKSNLPPIKDEPPPMRGLGERQSSAPMDQLFRQTSFNKSRPRSKTKGAFGLSLADIGSGSSHSLDLDTFRRMLRFALANTEALGLYTNFAIQEFTAENIQFLYTIDQVVKNSFTRQHEPQEFGKELMNIYETFVREGSPLQLNISSSSVREVTMMVYGLTSDEVTQLRKQESKRGGKDQSPHRQTTSIFATRQPRIHSKRMDQLSMIINRPTPLPGSIKDLVNWLKPAIAEVQNLLMRDSWPRFMKTDDFVSFCDVYKQQRELNTQLDRLELGPSNNSNNGKKKNIQFLLRKNSSDHQTNNSSSNNLSSRGSNGNIQAPPIGSPNSPSSHHSSSNSSSIVNPGKDAPRVMSDMDHDFADDYIKRDNWLL